jgi:hypothetical protein
MVAFGRRFCGMRMQKLAISALAEMDFLPLRMQKLAISALAEMDFLPLT